MAKWLRAMVALLEDLSLALSACVQQLKIVCNSSSGHWHFSEFKGIHTHRAYVYADIYIYADKFLKVRSKINIVAGGMAHWLKALAAIGEDLSLIPSTHKGAHNHLELRSDALPWPSQVLHAQGTQINM